MEVHLIGLLLLYWQFLLLVCSSMLLPTKQQCHKLTQQHKTVAVRGNRILVLLSGILLHIKFGSSCNHIKFAAKI